MPRIVIVSNMPSLQTCSPYTPLTLEPMKQPDKWRTARNETEYFSTLKLETVRSCEVLLNTECPTENCFSSEGQ
jgi:hypothetical protein